MAQRTNPRQLAALSSVVRAVVDAIAARGGPSVAAQKEALDAVDAFVRGGKLTKKEAERLSKAAAKEAEHFGVGSPPAEKAVYWIAGPTCRLLKMATVGIDDSTELLTQAGYALGSLHEIEWGEYKKRTDDAYARALEAHAALPDEPLPERPKRVNAARASAEQDLLGRSRAALPPFARTLLDRIGAERDAKQAGTKEDLAAVLEKHGYPLTDAVLRFEEDFGGLLVPKPGAERWREENLWGLCGAYGCLKLGGDRLKRDGLTPVFYGSNDEIGFLDAAGHALMGNAVDGRTEPCAPDGATMVAAVLGAELLLAGAPGAKGNIAKPGLIGDVVAEKMGLPLVLEAPYRLWASAEAAMCEMEGTRMAAFTDAAWTLLQDVVSKIEPTPADLFTTWWKTRNAGDRERGMHALLAAVSACDSFASVEALFSPWSVPKGVFDGGPDGWSELASALVARAKEMPGEDGARTLGWTVTQGAKDNVLVRAWRGEPGQRRDAWCEAVEGHMALFHDWVQDASVQRRTAGAYALSWCMRATPEELGCLLAAARGEKDPGALASQIVAIAAIVARVGAERGNARDVLVARVGRPASLVSLCAVVGLVTLGEQLTPEWVDVLVHHARRAAEVPAEWGWKSVQGNPRSEAMAWDAFDRMKVSDPEKTVADLVANLEDPKIGPGAQAVKRALATAAFGGRGASPPREGLVFEELDALQRRAIGAIATGSRFVGSIGGLKTNDLQAMLEGKTVQWRAIEVEIGGKPRRWHFARILAAVAFGDLDPAAGQDRVMAAFAPDEAADLATSWSSARVALDRYIEAGDQRVRMLRFCIGLLDGARARGVDVDAICRDFKKSPSADVGILAIWSLGAHADGGLPADHLPLYARAMAQKWWPEELVEKMRGLPKEALTPILEGAGALEPGARAFVEKLRQDPST